MTTKHQEDPVLTKVSIAIVSESNNPRLINPDFLAFQKIVPKDWVATDVIVTPPVARVTYENNFLIQVLEEKINIEITDPRSFDWKNILPDIAIEYITVLPKVSYRAVGLNYHAMVRTDADSDDFICRNFLKSEGLSTEHGNVTSASIKLNYNEMSVNFNLEIETGKFESGKVYGCKGNYHLDFEPGQVNERKKHISDLVKYHDEFIKILKQLPLN